MAKNVDIPESVLRAATRGALNRAIRRAFTESSRKVREVYNVKAKDVKKYTKIRRATGANPSAELRIKGQRLPVMVFGARQTAKGVSVRIKKKGGRKLIRSAFIRTLKSGKTSVFRRRQKGSKLVPRLPIDLLTTLDPPKMFEKEGDAAIKKVANLELPRIFADQLKFRLLKQK
jgi:hypothetical protein